MNIKGWARISQTNVVVLCSFTAHIKDIKKVLIEWATGLPLFLAGLIRKESNSKGLAIVS